MAKIQQQKDNVTSTNNPVEQDKKIVDTTMGDNNTTTDAPKSKPVVDTTSKPDTTNNESVVNDNINILVTAKKPYIIELEQRLHEYGALMSRHVAYSRINGPKNQLLIVNIYESVFDRTDDYDVMRDKIFFLLKFTHELTLTDDDYLAEDMIFRGIDYTPISDRRRENFIRLATLIRRLENPATRQRELKMIDFGFIFKYSTSAKHIAMATDAIVEISECTIRP